MGFPSVAVMPEVSGSVSSYVPRTKLSHKTIKVTAYMGKVMAYIGMVTEYMDTIKGNVTVSLDPIVKLILLSLCKCWV